MTALRLVALATAVGAGVTGGAMFAFSSFVMPALRGLPAADAVTAMQAINEAAPRSLLMLPLFATGLGSLTVAALSVTGEHGPGRGWLLAGAVAGAATFAITAAYHVPRNNALALVDAHTAGAAPVWDTYAAGWTRWNHVRTGAGLASAALLVAGVARSAS
jgi:uncharacterized membrane protein